MILTNATLANFSGAGNRSTMNGLDDVVGSRIKSAAIVVQDSAIVWVGKSDDIPREYFSHDALDVAGRWITPGLIDCHTHLVFGGNRANEFELRLQGASYAEIAQAGGGILSTVRATRDASEASLLDSALTRVDALLREGVCTIEIKSGYGLDLDTELKMLRVARQIAETRPVRVRTSFLGAHAIPPEFRGQADQYIEQICLPALRAAHTAGLVDAVDGFCEGIAFSMEQMERVFQAAKSLGLPVKLHAEQLSRLGGTQLAARYHALSADHLEYANELDAQAMAQAGSVAVMLPGAFYTLHEKQLPPVDAFRAHRVPMAVATDCNPGSSPLCSILLAMNMACTLFRLTPDEALAGVTEYAAQALGLEDTGVIAVGKRADLAIWDIDHPNELAYRIGFNPLWKRVFAGSFGC